MEYRRRVQFYETDAQGIVHHSNYFRYFEEARGEFLRILGTPYSQLRDRGYEVVLLSATCNFKKPLLYDEEFCIKIRVDHMDRFKFEFSYEVSVDGEVRAEGMTTHCMIKEGKIASIPADIVEKLREVKV